MANHFLISARILSEEAQSEPDEPVKPLSTLLLSACALESFINQLCFFLSDMCLYLSDIKMVPEHCCIPAELTENPVSFQRHNELTEKWDILGKALCNRNWPPDSTLWNNFKNLIYFRNELVHFKIGEFEQVVPEPKTPHSVLRKISPDIEMRKIPHAWPSRLLTPSFASWCVNVADGMIKDFKERYKKTRKSIK